MSDEHRTDLTGAAGTQVIRTVLLDGVVGAAWAILRDGDSATLVVEPVVRVSRTRREALLAEGLALLPLLAVDATAHDVHIA